MLADVGSSLSKGCGVGVDAWVVDHAEALVDDALVREVVVQQPIQELPLLCRAPVAGGPPCKPGGSEGGFLSAVHMVAKKSEPTFHSE